MPASDDPHVDNQSDAGAPMTDAPQDYLISIRGCLGPNLHESFAPLNVTTGRGRTELRGRVEDQSALYGILLRIQSLGLRLDEVIRVTDESEPTRDR